MTISAPANAGTSLSLGQSPTKVDLKRSAEDDSRADQTALAPDQLTRHADLAAMQLSRLQALAMSLARPDSSTVKQDGSDGVLPLAGESRMDLYA